MTLKKSESLEIRIPYPTKEAFMAKCRQDGRSASEALRALIDTELETPPPAAKSRRTFHLVAGALAALACAAAAVPSLARPNLQAEFRRMDLNGDGVVSFQEFTQHQNAIARITHTVAGR